MRVGFCGYATSGKDVAAQALVDERGFVRVNMSDALLRDLRILNPLVETPRGRAVRLLDILDTLTFEQAKANYPDLRTMLQVYGTDVWRSVDEDVWVRRARQEAARHERVVTTGIRFDNELADIDVLIYVERPNVGAVNAHVSDRGIVDLIDRAQHRLVNDGSVGDLRKAALSVIDAYL
jgi:hypothetical protein